MPQTAEKKTAVKKTAAKKTIKRSPTPAAKKTQAPTRQVVTLTKAAQKDLPDDLLTYAEAGINLLHKGNASSLQYKYSLGSILKDAYDAHQDAVNTRAAEADEDAPQTRLMDVVTLLNSAWENPIAQSDLYAMATLATVFTKEEFAAEVEKSMKVRHTLGWKHLQQACRIESAAQRRSFLAQVRKHRLPYRESNLVLGYIAEGESVTDAVSLAGEGTTATVTSKPALPSDPKKAVKRVNSASRTLHGMLDLCVHDPLIFTTVAEGGTEELAETQVELEAIIAQATSLVSMIKTVTRPPESVPGAVVVEDLEVEYEEVEEDEAPALEEEEEFEVEGEEEAPTEEATAPDVEFGFDDDDDTDFEEEDFEEEETL